VFVFSVFFFSPCCSQAREAAKSGLVLFHEAMEKFKTGTSEERFERFERAAAKGHAESVWIVSVWKDVAMEDRDGLKEAFAQTEEPLGWYLAGLLSNGREAFDFWKKSAEGGCSWGQVEHGDCFRLTRVVRLGNNFVEKDQNVYLEWIEKAADQNNPRAMHLLGHWCKFGGGNMKKALSYFRAGAELGWQISMSWLASMLRDGVGCERDMRQAVIWSTKQASSDCLLPLVLAKSKTLWGDLDDQLRYTVGGGIYWYGYGCEGWYRLNSTKKALGNSCFGYYCSCVELQQKSIFTFLWFWNRTTGVKGPGQMIAQMVWEQREDNLVKKFEASDVAEPEMKRIKQ
jgi:hypothetical protein